MQEPIEVGYQAFVSDGGEEFGAVREVSPNGRPELVIYVENAGDFVVPISAWKRFIRRRSFWTAASSSAVFDRRSVTMFLPSCS